MHETFAVEERQRLAEPLHKAKVRGQGLGRRRYVGWRLTRRWGLRPGIRAPENIRPPRLSFQRGLRKLGGFRRLRFELLIEQLLQAHPAQQLHRVPRLSLFDSVLD